MPLLKCVLEKGLKAIEEVYGVGREEVRVFVHYVPQFFHFHGEEGWEEEGRAEGCMYLIAFPTSQKPLLLVFVSFLLPGPNLSLLLLSPPTVHFSRLSLAHGIEVERAHLLSDIIDKIESAPPGKEYYEQASISYTVKKSEELYKGLQHSGAWSSSGK